MRPAEGIGWHLVLELSNKIQYLYESISDTDVSCIRPRCSWLNKHAFGAREISLIGLHDLFCSVRLASLWHRRLAPPTSVVHPFNRFPTLAPPRPLPLSEAKIGPRPAQSSTVPSFRVRFRLGSRCY